MKRLCDETVPSRKKVLHLGATPRARADETPTYPCDERPGARSRPGARQAHFAGAPAAKIVRDLALKGAESLEREQAERDDAIERLVELASGKSDLIDWDAFATIEQTAWDG